MRDNLSYNFYLMGLAVSFSFCSFEKSCRMWWMSVSIEDYFGMSVYLVPYFGVPAWGALWFGQTAFLYCWQSPAIKWGDLRVDCWWLTCDTYSMPSSALGSIKQMRTLPLDALISRSQTSNRLAQRGEEGSKSEGI
jgi:hypothetical protein